MRTAQHREDRILDRLLTQIGVTTCVAVEFGAGDGRRHSNTARLRDRGWRVVLFDADPQDPMVTLALVTRANVNDLFRAHDVPHAFDVLSIDIDGNDLWIWEALTFRPRIVVIEYNPIWPISTSVTVPYDDDRIWDRTNYYGASVAALYRLARRKGYRLVGWTAANLIFVQKHLVWSGLKPQHVTVPRPGKPADPLHRPWVTYR